MKSRNIVDKRRPHAEDHHTAIPGYDVPPDSSLTTLNPAARALYEGYSEIPPDEVIPHILRIRASALSIYAYPCIGQFRFLQFSISLLPAYPRILERLKSAPSSPSDPVPSLLDIGCCLGQDLRKLVFDGVPGDRLVGIELEQPFIDLGFDLFRDKEKFQGAMIAANILDPSMEALFETMKGRFEVVHAASFFHLADWEKQVAAAVKIVAMMRENPGVMVVGRQIGNVKPGEYPARSGRPRYLHDAESWRRMWDEVGEKTNTKWETQVIVNLERFGEGEGSDGAANAESTKGTSFMQFEVTRLG